MAEPHWDVVIRADDKNRIDWKGLKRCRDLIVLWVRRNFVSKYKQTVLGPAWAVIQPVLTTVVFTIVFGEIAGLGASGVPNAIFYFSGTVIWTLFSNCLIQNSSTFISNAGVMGKVYFPRLVMPISTAISQFITFGIQFAIMLLLLAYYLLFPSLLNPGTAIHPNLCILLMPVLLVQTAVLGTGLGVIISSLTTKYRDLTMAVGFFITLWQYASPVAYDMFGRRSLYERHPVYYVYMLNPVTPIINMFRHAFLGTGTMDWVDWTFYGVSLVMTVIVAVVSVKMFSRVERTFMDTI